MRISRREALRIGAGAGAALLFGRSGASAQQAELITKAIPSSGERLPVIGLGSALTFNVEPQDPNYSNMREVARLFHQLGGTVVDTSPTYGRSEIALGEMFTSLNISDSLFIATKVNVGGSGKARAERQMETSLTRFGKRPLDLIQVWNLGDSIARLTDAHLATHMEALREAKAAGRIRYLGITTSRDPQYADFERAMSTYELDFVQLDYSIGDRLPEQRLLPLAQERKIAVIINRPFGAGELFARVRGRPLPDVATELGITSWAQFFLKWIVSHPAVTCAVPATSDPGHLRDNMGACVGRLPDEAARRRMVTAFEAV